MKIKTDKECVEELFNDPRFRQILSMAPSDKDRKMIEETTVRFISSLTGRLAPIAQEYQRNPDAFKKKESDEIDESLIIVDSNKK